MRCSLVRSAPPSYAVSVRRLGTLPARVDRFPLTSGFLQIPPRGGHPCLRLTLPTTKRVVDFHHQAIAHGGRTTTARQEKSSPAAFLDTGGRAMDLDFRNSALFCLKGGLPNKKALTESNLPSNRKY